MIVGNDHVALIGGYNPEGHNRRVVLGRLTEGRFDWERMFNLALPDDRDLPQNATFLARNPWLYAFDGADRYSIHIDALVESADRT